MYADLPLSHERLVRPDCLASTEPKVAANDKNEVWEGNRCPQNIGHVIVNAIPVSLFNKLNFNSNVSILAAPAPRPVRAARSHGGRNVFATILTTQQQSHQPACATCLAWRVVAAPSAGSIVRH